MHFAIRYLTEYRYREPVTDNLNALRVKPATTPVQRVDDFGVRVEPETRLHQHSDYFGTTVIEFGISRPHEHLSIDVRARVVTAPPPEKTVERTGDRLHPLTPFVRYQVEDLVTLEPLDDRSELRDRVAAAADGDLDRASLDLGGHRSDPAREAGGGQWRPRGQSLLQQADSGGSEGHPTVQVHGPPDKQRA